MFLTHLQLPIPLIITFYPEARSSHPIPPTPPSHTMSEPNSPHPHPNVTAIAERLVTVSKVAGLSSVLEATRNFGQVGREAGQGGWGV